MSVDTRLRKARPAEDATWQAGLDLALDGVVRGTRRRRVRRAAAVVGAVAAVLAVAGLATTQGSDPDRLPIAPSGTPSPTAAPRLQGSSPVDGTWRTRKLDRQDVVAALERDGISSTIANEFVTSLPAGEFRYRMSISRGLLQARINHQEPPVFRVVVSLSGSSLTMTPMTGGYGHWTYGWQLAGDRLGLDLHGTTVPDFDGFSSRVQALAAFCVAPFTKAG
jgi:hypothetical protein